MAFPAPTLNSGDPIATVRGIVEAPFNNSVDLAFLFALVVFAGCMLGLWGIVMSHLHLAME
jgi:hypothetical protein